MQKTNEVLAYGTPCHACKGRGVGCKDCYSVGIEGINHIAVSTRSNGDSFVSTSIRTRDDEIVQLYFDPLLQCWQIVKSIRYMPEHCLMSQAIARETITNLLVRAGILELVKSPARKASGSNANLA